MRKNINALFGTTMLILLSIAAVSCTKDYDFYYSKVGGSWIFDFEIDGETLRITDGEKTSAPPMHTHSQSIEERFISELDNISVYYRVQKRNVFVSVSKNDTGKLLRYKIYGYLNGEEKSIIVQQE